MRTMILIAGLALMIAGTVSAQPIFYEPFDNNSAGWTLGTEWQIGAATAGGAGSGYGSPDPGSDAQSVPGGGVAGVVIGGDAAQVVHPYDYITSPVIDTTVIPSPAIAYNRWLNSDYDPYMHNVVEVFDGTSWVPLWGPTGPSPGIQDASWTPQQFDITPYSNALFQVRFGFDIGSSGVFSVSSWNLDDVTIADASNDVGVISVDAPLDPNVSGPQTVTVTIQNFGTVTQTSIPVWYFVDMGAAVNETYVGSIAAGATDTFSFTTQANLAAGPHTITGYTLLVGDGFPGNDASTASVTTFDYPYPGTPMGDLELGTGVNAAPSSGFGTFTKTATALDTINLDLVSPTGTYDFQPFVLLTQPFTTGTPPNPTIPGLVYLDLSQPFVILVDIDPFLTQTIDPGGTPYSFIMPLGFAGQSFLFQGACVTPALSVTDGYEIQVL